MALIINQSNREFDALLILLSSFFQTRVHEERVHDFASSRKRIQLQSPGTSGQVRVVDSQ